LCSISKTSGPAMSACDPMQERTDNVRVPPGIEENGTLVHSATSSSARKQTEVTNAYDNPDSGTR
jgi:hypothetical protein